MSDLTEEDYCYSATLRDLRPLDKMLSKLLDLPEHRRPATFVDLGCGLGGVTLYVASRLGIQAPIGVEWLSGVLERASFRGVQPIQADLNCDRVPIDDATIDLVTSFGVFEHLHFYDNLIAEAARVLKDEGSFLLSMPNLGSYSNRAALALGFQSKEVEVSREVPAGVMPFYRARTDSAPLGSKYPQGAHLHAATLRGMRELLLHNDFRIKCVTGLSPEPKMLAIRLLDGVFGRL